MEDHRRYLLALRAACARRPDAHAHQLVALDREIALAVTDDAAQYGAASGDLFELTRALWLDRLANHARVSAAVGDRLGARAAAAEHALVLEATGHDDWVGCGVHAGPSPAAEKARAVQCGTTFGTLLLAVLALPGALDEGELAGLRTTAAAAHATLLELDPEFSWSRAIYGGRCPWEPAAVRDRLAGAGLAL